MTTPTDRPPPKTETLDVDKDSRLYQLLETYAALLPEYEDVTQRHNDLKTAIKTEMESRRSTQDITTVRASSQRFAAVMVWKVARKFQTTKFKAAHPDLYESFREAKGNWELRKQ